MYGIIHTTEVVHKLKPIEKLILTIACIGHGNLIKTFNTFQHLIINMLIDLDHPGNFFYL
jgi:hypothetical protein